jgi:hypothetical protein
MRHGLRERRAPFRPAALALLLAAVITPAPSRAASIPVANPSFETLPDGGLGSGCGGGCTYAEDLIPGWTNTPYAGLGLSSGQFRPGTESGNLTYFSSLSDGPTSAFTTTGCIGQTTGALVQPGVTYTLVVDVGWRWDAGPYGLPRLLVNGIYYDGSGTPVRGGWAPFTATYVGQAADAGLPIVICLTSVTLQGNFDNVRFSDSTSSVGVDDGSPAPAAPLEAGPNPFTTATYVRYALAAPAPVSLRVFDVRGRPVRTLVMGADQAAGAHEAAWDGTDDAGVAVPTGIYFLRLVSGSERRTVRVLRAR